jgi:hypothetical protein
MSLWIKADRSNQMGKNSCYGQWRDGRSNRPKDARLPVILFLASIFLFFGVCVRMRNDRLN